MTAVAAGVSGLLEKEKGGFKDGSRPYRKGGGKSGKEELLARIAKTHCKLCGALGHWRAECPQRKEARETANVAFSMPSEASDAEEETNQVVFEELSEQECTCFEPCFVVSCHRKPVFCKRNVEDVKAFWSKKLNKPGYKWGNKGVIGDAMVTNSSSSENSMQSAVVTSAPNTRAARKMHPRPTNRADGFVSQNHSDAMQSQGMAILDTGASRSVIGQDHVPAMLQKLPASVRDQVVEKPSRVGFRFGNNQVAYSYKQLRIPLVHKGIRIWLLIEVVPKATPFLLSIKTMKSLGAMIDLGQNTCFLKTLQRSLHLKENKNGLFMIDMSDLCQPDVKSSAAAFVASSVCAPPPGLESEIPVSHADPSGSARSSSHSGRGSVSQPETPDDHRVYHDQCDRSEPRSHGSPDESSESADSRSGPATSDDRSVGESDSSPVPAEATHRSRTYREPGEPCSRIRRFRMGSRDGAAPKPSCINGAKFFPIDACRDDECQSSQQSASSNASETAHTARANDTKCPTTSCNDGKPRIVLRSFRDWKPIDGDSSIPRKLGKQDRGLWQKAPEVSLRPCVRVRPRVHQVDFGQGRQPVRGCGGFRKLCPSSQSTGAIGQQPGSMRGFWEGFQDSRMSYKSNFKERQMWTERQQPEYGKSMTKFEQLDILEVYAFPNSMLTTVAQEHGLRARRFTYEDGDLSTPTGRKALFHIINTQKPKHIWLAPECGPWCAWNRFNSMRSLSSYQQIMNQQRLAKEHLVLCNVVAQIQHDEGRHTHLESPKTSGVWKQQEIQPFLKRSIPAQLDQCAFGLRHPSENQLMRKSTRIQTTSVEMFSVLDCRVCNREHSHSTIAGRCQWKGHSISVSRFAAFYPRKLALTIVRGIMQTSQGPYEAPICHVDEIEPPAKRARTNSGEASAPHDTTSVWKPMFEFLQRKLPKSGVVTWEDPQDEVFQEIQKLFPHENIGAVKAGKGLDRLLLGEEAWRDQLPRRHSIVQKRFTHEIIDLGLEVWSELARKRACRKEVPSHIMLCLFSRDDSRPDAQVMPAADPAIRPVETKAAESTASPPVQVDVPSWTPLSAAVSGPNFLKLTREQQSMLRKIHNNLGHPTAERLARHLKESKAHEHLVEGAADFVCPSCAERHPPQKTTPGQLKDPKDFNERILLDGFDWCSKRGIQVYVFHILDDATRFHLGQRITRDTQASIRTTKQMWIQWAGAPQEILHDQGGEFVSQPWKDFLQAHSIQPVLTAAPWQRGRIERHGGVIKEMLTRMDHAQNFNSLAEIDEALNQCFRAKNSMIVNNGYSPEQAVLGKASKLPGSLLSDEESSAHHMCLSSDPASEQFKRSLELRTAARAAFWHADNHAAIRRAALHRSRGVIHEWLCGQLCMFWDKRKAPNILEKGRWCGPAQIVCQESRTIIWITHMNRLLRCAHENLRPVSMREFQRHSTFTTSNTQEELKQMAQRLQSQLKEKSGMFQYSDLSEVNPPTEEEANDGNSELSTSRQPEEEPTRRQRGEIEIPDEVMHDPAVETPVPDSPFSSNSEERPESMVPSPSLAQSAPDTASLDTDQSESEPPGDMEPVYNAVILEKNTETTDCVLDDDALWSMPDPCEAACVSFEFEMPKQQLHKFLKSPKEHLPEVNAAARKFGRELVYSDLTPQEKERFKQAKLKELNCWLDTQTVRTIVRDKIHPSRVLASRWILTWKEDENSEDGKKPKARLVVKGFQDPDIGELASDSPTLTRDGRMLLLQTAASHKWCIESFDITTAFLRGKSDDRQLAMEPPKELRELLGMENHQICLLEGNAYGRVDAPLLFYREFRKCLEEVGFTAHPLDNCLYLLRDPKDPKILNGIVGTHVDDGLGAGNQKFNYALQQLQKKLPFGSHEKRKFRFTGLEIEQLPDFSIKVSQEKYVQRINPIDIPKPRRAEVDSPITPQELNKLRGICGSLQYAAVHSRPDVAAKVAHLQKGITKATVQTLLDANRVLKETQEFANTSVIVRPIPMTELCFASFGDASFASAKQMTAQQGIFIMACTRKLANNETTDFSPVAWHTKQIGRVVRSTLSAEAYAMSSSLDKLTWIRCMWGYIKDPSFAWHKPEKSLCVEPPGLMITDCKSLYDLVTKTAVPNCQEWRTTIEVMLLKEQSANHTQCRWISTAIMLADCLTKSMDSTFLRTVLQLGRFRIYDEEMTLKQNSNRKYGVTWVKQSNIEKRPV